MATGYVPHALHGPSRRSLSMGATYSLVTGGMIYLRAGGVLSSWSLWTSLPIDLTTTSAWSIEAV